MDGYIIMNFGPFFANKKHSDGNILTWIVENTDFIKEYLPNDHLALVDRGFWPTFEAFDKKYPGLGHQLFDMISPSHSHMKPVPTLDINLSRFVTHCRWVIEAVFGVLKEMWPILTAMIHPSNKLYMKSVMENILAIHNYLQYVSDLLIFRS